MRTHPPPYRPFDRPVTQRVIAKAGQHGVLPPLTPVAGPPVYRPTPASLYGRSMAPIQRSAIAPTRPVPPAPFGQPIGIRNAFPALRNTVGVRRFVKQACQQRFCLAGGSIQAKFAESSTETSSVPVPDSILSEIESMLDAADKQKGEASPGFSETMKTLLGADKHFKDELAEKGTKTMSSQDTFGIGGASYFPGVMTTVSVGSTAYSNSISQHQGMGNTTHLGGREACIHGEVALITEYPGLQSVVTTQAACLFCYGLLCKRGYEHQALRQNVWPQKWTHDYMGFKLILWKPIYKANVPVVEITWNNETRYYKVET